MHPRTREVRAPDSGIDPRGSGSGQPPLLQGYLKHRKAGQAADPDTVPGLPKAAPKTRTAGEPKAAAKPAAKGPAAKSKTAAKPAAKGTGAEPAAKRPAATRSAAKAPATKAKPKAS